MIHSHAFANTIQLYSESHTARRLFKVRHHEMDKMEIYTQTLTESAAASAIHTNRHCTVYAFQIRSNGALSSTTSATETPGGEWLLTRRYSELAAFRNELLRLVRTWESQLDNGIFSHKIQSREFELVSNSVRRPLTPNFPRKHLRRDTDKIVDERRRGFRDFVRKLLDAYADMSVYLFHNPSSRYDKETGAGKTLSQIFELLETFLQVPQGQKELEKRHTAAVLALEDVLLGGSSPTSDPEGETHEERTCCICLSDDDCPATTTEESSASSSSEKEMEEQQETGGQVEAADKMVKLPCGHQYHEDCVIEWFNTSVTCPLCRQPAVGDKYATAIV